MYKELFNAILQKSQNREDKSIRELMNVFRSWVASLPMAPPELSYIHAYIDARVRKGHGIITVLTDLQPQVEAIH